MCSRLFQPCSGVFWRFWGAACLVAVTGLWPLAAQQQRDADARRGQWEVLENCELLSTESVDGDSFHVLHEGREYVFRLYFVDTPETDASLRDRIQDQAAYFGVGTEAVLRGGLLAARFTREQLSREPFTVVTRWQNAMGRSSLARFYGIVLVDGGRLEEELVRAGWARIYGLRANWPEDMRSATFINRLKNIELEAREQHRGMWNEEMFARRSPGEGSEPPAAAGVPRPVNVNEAGLDELQQLPGIGKVLAGRIIAHRPYQDLKDLDAVPGIGPKTLERLRPLITFESATNAPSADPSAAPAPDKAD